MKNNGRSRLILLLVLDVLMIAMEVFSISVSWAESGWKLFRYYTQNSNIFALIVCAACAAAEVSCLRSGSRLPAWTRPLRYYAACFLCFTLVVAGFFLAPTDPDLGFSGFMLQGKYLFLHTVCPLVGIVQYLLHRGRRFREKHALRALLPTIVYGAISLWMNAAGVYSGPYPFLRVREQAGYVTAVGCVAVLGVAYAAARLLAAFSCIGGKKQV